MKHLILLVLVMASFSLSAQTVRNTDDGKIVRVEEIEIPTSTAQIDQEIKSLESGIESLKTRIEKLKVTRKEVEAMEKSFGAKALPKKKK